MSTCTEYLFTLSLFQLFGSTIYKLLGKTTFRQNQTLDRLERRIGEDNQTSTTLWGWQPTSRPCSNVDKQIVDIVPVTTESHTEWMDASTSRIAHMADGTYDTRTLVHVTNTIHLAFPTKATSVPPLTPHVDQQTGIAELHDRT